MSRIKRFQAAEQVTDQFLHEADKELIEAYIKEHLEQALSRTLTGPRGGRYEPIGEITYLGRAQVDEDFIRNLWTYAARRQGKYVRPKR